MRYRTHWLMGLVILAGGPLSAPAGDWPQFRGPNATGVSAEHRKLPDQIGPDQNVRWKVAVPEGISSPVVFGDRVYLTGVNGEKLLTFALDAGTGKKLWEAEAVAPKLEKIHQVGSRAQSTPATDGRVVVSFFGSKGLFAYDRDGRELWSRPFGPFSNDFGAGSSPVLVGERVILNQDHDLGSFLMALDKSTGKTIWKTDRSEFPRGYATPVVWEVSGKKQIVVAGTLRVIGYDFESGKELWTVRGLARIVNMTPTVGGDGVLYVPAWSPGGDEGSRLSLPPWDEVIAKHDTNKNGTLEMDEVPAGPLKDRFTQIDRDKDGHITKAEFEEMRRIFGDAQNLILAVKPGGSGDITKTHVLWKQKKGLPYVPSPLYYEGQLYMVRNGGLLTCLDAKTGKPLKEERVYGTGQYFSSPVAGDGKIYLADQRGSLSVITADPNWKVLGKARLGEDVMATPAVANGRIYLRTAGHLYCFGLPETTSKK